jgi:hypothetical protein
MTEEKFNELKTLKEEINKLEFKLSTINNLLESVNLNMEIKGTSTCHFKINRFINIGGDNFIKTILDSERKTTEFNLSQLKQEFEKK